MLMTPYLADPIGGALALLTLPLVVELAVLTLASRLPKRRRVGVPGAGPVRLAVIVPAHNEEVLIEACVESLRNSAAGTGARIVVIAHNCTDRTAGRAALAGAEVIVYDDPQARGKGAALRMGFEYATSQDMDATLVVDADSTVSLNLIGAVCEAIANGADAVQCRYEMESSTKRPATKLTALAFRGFNVVRAAGRDRLGLSAGIFGNGFAIRQAVLIRNPYRSLSVVEDLEFHVQLVMSGIKVQFLPDTQVCSGLPSSRQGEASQRSRWEGGRAHAAVSWFGPLLKQVLRGRMRALEPMLDLVSLPIGYAAVLLVPAACLPMAWLRIYVLFAAMVLTGHVLAAAWAGNDFGGDLRILCRVPGYVLWKLCVIPNLLRSSRADAMWVRTERWPAQPTLAGGGIESVAGGSLDNSL
jgi:cellulose synthase/poly-beta-1,6-N-acetylglucosamine synthase-like glycosyltransferase